MLTNEQRQEKVSEIEDIFEEFLPELKKHGARSFAKLVVDEAVICGCESCFKHLERFCEDATLTSEALAMILNAVRKKEHRETRITEAEFTNMLMADVYAVTKDFARTARFVAMNVAYVNEMVALGRLENPEWRNYYDGMPAATEAQITQGEIELAKRLDEVKEAPAFIDRIVKMVNANEAMALENRPTPEALEKDVRELAGTLIADGVSLESVEISMTPNGLVLHGPTEEPEPVDWHKATHRPVH